MQNVTADIKFLAYEHTLAISKFKVLGKVSLWEACKWFSSDH